MNTTVREAAEALTRAVDTYGDRNPDPEGGSIAQLTIAARALLAALAQPTQLNSCTVAGCKGKMNEQRCSDCGRCHPFANWDGEMTSNTEHGA